MKRRKANSGMTLLEVVLAASIMASVVALIVTGYSRMAGAARVAKEYREGAELLDLKLNEVYGSDNLSALTLSGKFADVETLQTPLRDAAWTIETASRQTGLSEVKVTVTWRSNRGEESVSASTLKFLPNELSGQ